MLVWTRTSHLPTVAEQISLQPMERFGTVSFEETVVQEFKCLCARYGVPKYVCIYVYMQVHVCKGGEGGVCMLCGVRACAQQRAKRDVGYKR